MSTVLSFNHNKEMSEMQSLIWTASTKILMLAPLFYCVLITILVNRFPKLCKFRQFTISDCLILDDMHYDRNFFIFSSFCIACSILVLIKHKISQKQKCGLLLVIIHLLSTLSFIFSLILIKFEQHWNYHRICSYLAFILLITYQTMHSFLYYLQIKADKIRCHSILCSYFVVNNIISITSGIAFAISMDTLYITEWISFFAVIWYLAPYGLTFDAKHASSNQSVHINAVKQIEMKSLLNN